MSIIRRMVADKINRPVGEPAISTIFFRSLTKRRHNVDADRPLCAYPAGRKHCSPQSAAQVYKDIVFAETDRSKKPENIGVRCRGIMHLPVGVALHSGPGMEAERLHAQLQIPERVVRILQPAFNGTALELIE